MSRKRSSRKPSPSQKTRGAPNALTLGLAVLAALAAVLVVIFHPFEPGGALDLKRLWPKDWPKDWPRFERSEPPPRQIIVGTARVVDGDTIRIGSERIRLYGIDAFETDQTCHGTPCGRQATRALTDMIGNRPVSCSVRDIDRYERKVAVCSAGGQDLNAAMVSAGHAVAYRRYSQDYVAHENTARRARTGTWAQGFDDPEDWRHR